MARDYNKQTLWSYNGLAFDFGHQTFTTTGATLNIYTGLDVIKGFQITPIEAMTTPETFTISGINGTSVTAASIVNGEMRTDNGYVTITRAVPTNTTGAYSPYTLHASVGTGGTGLITSNQYVGVPIGYAHTAGNITRVAVYLKTNHATVGVMKLGKTNITADDDDYFVTTTNAIAMPASAKAVVTTNPVEGATSGKFAKIGVSAGDYIYFGTNGIGGADPVGLKVDLTITPTAPVLTSALDIYYMFWGY